MITTITKLGDKMAYIIAFEGIDGTGKGTQAHLLYERLTAAGHRCLEVSFPQYENFFGKEIGKLLAGKHTTTAANLDPKSMALWYASDRFQTFRNLDQSLYDYIILNRYVLSNVAYQSMRVPADERQEFANWVLELEFGQFDLPKPDICFVFDVDETLSVSNVAQKGHRDYIGNEPDVYEKSRKTQQAARQFYRELAKQPDLNCKLIECVGQGGAMLPIDEISDILLNTVNEKFN